MRNKENAAAQEQISRRQVLTGAGALAAGAMLGQIGGLAAPARAAGGSTEKWPWPYKKLDPEKTAEICYEEWYRVFCGAAVISSIFGQLRELIGEPYTSFPYDGFVYLEGGQVGWGTVCGAPAGANLVANLIIGPRIDGSTAGHQIATEMMEWYGKADMPVYMPKKPRVTDKLPTTQSNSPLCHVSVGRWMKAANKPLGSPERKDRCARVAASTAYHLVELLNAWKEGAYEANVDFNCSELHGITGQSNCADCHSGGVPTVPRDPEKKKEKPAPKA